MADQDGWSDDHASRGGYAAKGRGERDRGAFGGSGYGQDQERGAMGDEFRSGRRGREIDRDYGAAEYQMADRPYQGGSREIRGGGPSGYPGSGGEDRSFGGGREPSFGEGRGFGPQNRSAGQASPGGRGPGSGASAGGYGYGERSDLYEGGGSEFARSQYGGTRYGGQGAAGSGYGSAQERYQGWGQGDASGSSAERQFGRSPAGGPQYGGSLYGGSRSDVARYGDPRSGQSFSSGDRDAEYRSAPYNEERGGLQGGYAARSAGFGGPEGEGWRPEGGAQDRNLRTDYAGRGDEEDQGGGLLGRHKGRGPKGYVRSDERIHEEVNDTLTDDPQIDATHIHVEVGSGEVTLSGHVNSRRDKRRAEDLVERLSGVKHVQNNLRVHDSNYNAANATAGGPAVSGPLDAASPRTGTLAAGSATAGSGAASPAGAGAGEGASSPLGSASSTGSNTH